MFIIMLCTTGLIANPGQVELEARLLSDMSRFVNPGGGCWKFPGAPSSKRLTLLFATALRLALCKVPPGLRPASWYQRNPMLDAGLEEGLCQVLALAQHFIDHGRASTWLKRDLDLLVVAPLLAAHADITRPRLRALGWLPRPRHPNRHLDYFRHRGWPALNILLNETPSRRTLEHAAQIRQAQDPSGSWAIGLYVTMFNVMALVKVGAAADDPAVAKSHESLLRDFVVERNASATLAAWHSHVVNTGYGLDSCVRAKMEVMWQSALDFLLGVQTGEGGFAWGAMSAQGRC